MIIFIFILLKMVVRTLQTQVWTNGNIPNFKPIELVLEKVLKPFNFTENKIGLLWAPLFISLFIILRVTLVRNPTTQRTILYMQALSEKGELYADCNWHLVDLSQSVLVKFTKLPRVLGISRLVSPAPRAQILLLHSTFMLKSTKYCTKLNRPTY